MDALTFEIFTKVIAGLLVLLLAFFGKRIYNFLFHRDIIAHLALTEGSGRNNILGDLTLTIDNNSQLNCVIDAVYWEKGFIFKHTHRQFGFHHAQRYVNINVMGHSSHALKADRTEIIELIDGNNAITRFYKALLVRLTIKLTSGRRVYCYLGWNMLMSSAKYACFINVV